MREERLMWDNGIEQRAWLAETCSGWSRLDPSASPFSLALIGDEGERHEMWTGYNRCRALAWRNGRDARGGAENEII